MNFRWKSPQPTSMQRLRRSSGPRCWPNHRRLLRSDQVWSEQCNHDAVDHGGNQCLSFQEASRLGQHERDEHQLSGANDGQHERSRRRIEHRIDQEQPAAPDQRRPPADNEIGSRTVRRLAKTAAHQGARREQALHESEVSNPQTSTTPRMLSTRMAMGPHPEDGAG